MRATDTIRGNEEAERNIRGLSQFRKKRGLTQKELSQLSGISITDIGRYETQKRMPKVKNYNMLAKVFDWGKIPVEKAVKPKRAFIPSSPEKESDSLTVPFTVKFQFVEGHSYQIMTTEKQEKEPVKDCIFYYEGKKGIHHMFREISGKWTRTYTDAQLIGKKIREVSE